MWVPRRTTSDLKTCTDISAQMNSKKAGQWCDESLSLDENSLYGLLHKAKTQQAAESFEAAVRTLEQAGEAHPDQGNLLNPLLNEARVKLKRSKTKDYYKVLGVAHDADDRQIKSAYRKLSKQHHPDKAAKQGINKDEAEKKMQGINEAYEVLSKPELRERFDRGDDPMSNEQQQPFQGGGFPFGGGQPFMYQQGGGGGGQNFKFQFGSGFPFG
jgi:DnaJ homolog subfamily C member 3